MVKSLRKVDFSLPTTIYENFYSPPFEKIVGAPLGWARAGGGGDG